MCQIFKNNLASLKKKSNVCYECTFTIMTIMAPCNNSAHRHDKGRIILIHLRTVPGKGLADTSVGSNDFSYY